MKSLRILPMVALVTAGWITTYSQDLEPEVPGDQFSLEGALELFKQSKSPEEFEKMLNSPDAKVNNLDLNGDGYIDYIRVVDRSEGNVHAFILQALVSESESQDIAVIELEKLANGKAVLQIVGDEDIYGVTTIIEPTREVHTYAGTRTTHTVVNVWAWPSVQYIYGPRYSVWVSPWGWHHRPVWWRAWRPVTYVHYYSVWAPYHRYYAPCYTRRVVYAHAIYRPYRRSSVVVRDRYHDRITRYRVDHRDRDRYGHSRRNNYRSYVNNSRTVTRDVDGRRNDAAQNRRHPTSREVTKPSTVDRATHRPAATGMQRRPYAPVKPDASEKETVTTPNRAETHRRMPPSVIPDKGRSNAHQPATRRTSFREVPNAPEVGRKPGAVSAGHDSRAPMARPSAPTTRGRSGSPAVQHRSYDRSSGATRSDSNRRGRH